MEALNIFFVIVLSVLLVDVLMRWMRKTRVLEKYENGAGVQACSKETCGSIDPVSDPDYNMREIAKQSILLEEHLTVPAKYCPDCCMKHLLHLHGLATEAMMLAGKDTEKYPLLKEANDLYKLAIEEFRKNIYPSQDVERRLALASTLRDFRKNIVHVYYLSSPPPLKGE